uniref:PORR domain-containing protein n=1 Tax=Rhizophora mucronata TaxID=61149 RepID=A0A2P2KZ15_RHIMU
MAVGRPHQFYHSRGFIAARVKWVRDPYLDAAVSREKDLKPVISLKNQIISSPSNSLPLSSVSLLKQPQHHHHFNNLPTKAIKFLQKYSSLFTQFQPAPSFPLHVKLTRQAFSLYREEDLAIHRSPTHRYGAVQRLAKLLMLTGATGRGRRLPFHVIDRFKFDLGLPHNYVTSLLSDFPEYFHVSQVSDGMLCLELVSWRDELAVSEMERRAARGDLRNIKKGQRIGFSLSYPNGFELEKKVKDWVVEWQCLPYISPYEDAFHLNPNGDQAEKWTVAVLHELLWLLVSKKTERDNLVCLGQYLGFGDRFKKALVHHPGIFYISNKIRTQTVVLREAYRKDFLVEKHPLVGMRFRYIRLMNKRRKSVGSLSPSRVKRQGVLPAIKDQGQEVKNGCREGEEDKLNSAEENHGLLKMEI